MKTPLGTEVDLGPGHIVLDGNPAPPLNGHNSPPLSFRPMPRSPISATAELFFSILKLMTIKMKQDIVFTFTTRSICNTTL